MKAVLLVFVAVILAVNIFRMTYAMGYHAPHKEIVLQCDHWYSGTDGGKFRYTCPGETFPNDATPKPTLSAQGCKLLLTKGKPGNHGWDVKAEGYVCPGDTIVLHNDFHNTPKPTPSLYLRNDFHNTCSFAQLPDGGIAFSGPVGCQVNSTMEAVSDGTKWLLAHPHQQ